MEPKEFIAALESTTVFKEWQQNNRSSFLTSVFYSDSERSANYFIPVSNEMATFSENNKEPRTSEHILQNEKPQKLNVSSHTCSRREALDTAKEIITKHYAKEMIIKRILILQSNKGNTIWNITFFTATYNTINIKVDATDQKVHSHSLDSLINFIPGKRQRGVSS